MQDWEKRLNSFIEMFQYGLLRDAGKVTAEIAKLHAETEFEKYRIVQDKLFMSDYDRFLIELEGHIEGYQYDNMEYNENIQWEKRLLSGPSVQYKRVKGIFMYESWFVSYDKLYLEQPMVRKQRL